MSDRARVPTWAEAAAAVEAKKDDPDFKAEVELVRLLSKHMVQWLSTYEPGLAITVAVDALTTLMSLSHPEDGTDGAERVIMALKHGYAQKLDLVVRMRAKMDHRARARTGRG